MKQTVHIVDDEPGMVQIASKVLESEGYIVRSDTDALEGLKKIRESTPDLILLDICLGAVSGLDICKELMKDPKTAHVPIIMISVKAEESDVVAGLELGAADYVAKPFRARELVARARMVLRRHRGDAPQQQVERGPFKVDYRSYTATLDGTNLDLTPKQFELLGLFVSREGAVITRGTLLEKVWGADLSKTSRAVDSAVDQLRKKLGEYRDCIKSLKGVGYRFELED